MSALQCLCEERLESLIRKVTKAEKDPVCRSLVSVTEEQLETVTRLADWVETIPVSVVSSMFSRVSSYDGDTGRKMTPMDVWAFMHSGFKQLSIARRDSHYRPLPNTHKAILDCLHRLPFLEHLNLSGKVAINISIAPTRELSAGLDHTGVASDHNDITYSEELLEHYLYIITDSLSNLPNLVSLNLGSLANNNILRVVSNTCPRLRELRLRGPANVTDLGVRYLTGINKSAQQLINQHSNNNPGCHLLEVLDLTDISLSLHTITLLLIHLQKLTILDHNNLHEALWMMDKTGMDSQVIDLQLRGYNGRNTGQCKPDHLGVLAKLCPKIEKLHLSLTWPESFLFLSRFRHISHLSVFRVASVENFDLPLMAFGPKLVKLELTNCTNFQSGTALNIRKYCDNLRYLRLDIDSTDANSNAGIQEALQETNIHTLENQVMSLQERLNTLQTTMLTVMNKYDSLRKLEELHLRNLGMGSVLILLPFCPKIKKLTLKYSLRGGDDGAPNITDSLFLKIFEKNKFTDLERVEVWCKSLSIRTAEWFVRNCQELKTLRSLSGKIKDCLKIKAINIWIVCSLEY